MSRGQSFSESVTPADQPTAGLVPCPYCGVSRGHLCLGVNGQDRRTPHPSRVDAANRLLARTSDARERQTARQAAAIAASSAPEEPAWLRRFITPTESEKQQATRCNSREPPPEQVSAEATAAPERCELPPPFPVTHTWAGSIPPWDASLGQIRDFTPTEKEELIVCAPIDEMPKDAYTPAKAKESGVF